MEDSKYEKLFEEFKSNSRPALLYPCIFFLRRYIMILTLTMLKFTTYAQIQCQLTFTLGVASYVARTRPYNSPLLNKQELINELFVLMAGYPLLVFANPRWEQEQMIEAGYMLLSVVGLIAFCNICLSIYVLSLYGKLRCKRYKIKQEYKERLR